MLKKGLILAIVVCLANSCSEEKKTYEKGFSVSDTEETTEEKPDGLESKGMKLKTQPRGVLLTHHKEHRLTPIFKINYNKDSVPYTGSIAYHSSYYEDQEDGNNWHRNIMPGFEAIYGYNMVNVSHYHYKTQKESLLFNSPVLVKTVYYPTRERDTLNNKAIAREFYMVSCYDEDTNKDGYINYKDLRKFYSFDLDGENKNQLIPKGYTVMSSDYDSENDFMYVFTKLDENKNGQMETLEPTHIFWIDLKNPENVGLQYGPK